MTGNVGVFNHMMHKIPTIEASRHFVFENEMKDLKVGDSALEAGVYPQDTNDSAL